MKTKLSFALIFAITSLTACAAKPLTTNTSAPKQTLNHPSNVWHHEGKITGYDTKQFSFYAEKGQVLNISLATHAPFAYFNIFAPNSDEALFNSSIQGEQFEAIAPATGEYKISVYQMRASARRNQTVPFRLEIIVN